MKTLEDVANALYAAADVARNGHASAARRMAEHAVEALRALEPKDPEKVGDVLARHEFQITKAEG